MKTNHLLHVPVISKSNKNILARWKWESRNVFYVILTIFFVEDIYQSLMFTEHFVERIMGILLLLYPFKKILIYIIFIHLVLLYVFCLFLNQTMGP